MDFIFDNLKIIIGLLVAVFWIIGKISEAKRASQEGQPQPQPWEADEDYENWEPEQVPRDQPPPIPQFRNAPPPPLPVFVAAPDEELQRQRVMHERLASIRSEKRSGPMKKIAAKKPAAPAALVSPSIKARLRDRKELRRAFVMREILDPPVSLR